MRKISAVLVILIGICYACEKKEDPKYAGEFLLSSELLQSGQSYSFYGFTFEDGQIKMYPASSSVLPDISVTYNDFNPDTIVITLESSNHEDAFHKNGDFSSNAEAENFFNSYLEVTTNNFKALADTVKVNQIWTVKTALDKFAKIWVKDIQLKKGTLDDFAELKIQYQYQPDGTKIFPN